MLLGNVLDIGTPSDGTVTTAKIADDAVTSAKLSGVNEITEADMWRLTANISASVDPISSNLERVDDASFSKIGTGMSVSSGVWSFPSTGIWKISATNVCSPGSDDNIIIAGHVTTDDGSAYDEVFRAIGGGAGNLYRSSTESTFVDVTDISNVKVKFEALSISSPSVIAGDTGYNYSFFEFIRLGDT
jgi:hypothetical protein